MTTTTAPAFTHTDPCEALAIGANVLNLIAAGGTVLNLDELAAIVDANPRPRCTCGRDALRKVEADLTLARKRERAYRNSAAFGSAEYSVIARDVETLIARRTAIREALA